MYIIKFEARNPGEASRRDQFETNSNDQSPKIRNEKGIMGWTFENWNLGFVSEFDIRISDLSSKIDA
jgi:hypothetical protein